MDDFSSAAVMWFIILLFMGSAVLFGSAATEDDIRNQCEDFNKMSTDDKVYKCKLIKESA